MSATTTRPFYRIASIPGDGIGPEVISAGIGVLQKLAHAFGTFDLQFEHFDWSSSYYKKHGRYIPEGGLEQLRKYNAIFFGAVGDPGITSMDYCGHCSYLDCKTAKQSLQTSQITYPFGPSGSPSSNPYNTTPICGPLESCEVLHLLSPPFKPTPRTLTGS